MQEVRLIDANALHDRVSRMGLQNGSVLGHHSGTADIIAEMIQNAPTIDPESLRPVAHWENDPNGAGSDVFSCSNCCERICLDDQGYFPEMDYKFCPYYCARIENV